MASFELSKEMEKDVFLSCHKTKKKCESQWGNEPQTFKARDPMVSEAHTKFTYDMCPAYC